jgi:hypothetical protein
MKHLLNDLSEEEKNRIREQHTGGKKFIIENFKKLVDTRLGDAKPYLNEEEEMKGTGCKEGDYFVGTTKMNEEDVKKRISKYQEPFSGSKCIGGKKTQVTCQKEGETLKCDEATD